MAKYVFNPFTGNFDYTETGGTVETDPLSLHLDQTSSQTIINGQPIQDTLTASEIVATDGSKKLQSLAVATYPSLTELSYVKGATSAIQTQLGLKAPIANPTFTTKITTPLIDVSSGLMTLTGGSAITAGSYQIGRNADATNRMQYNVPTGTIHEFSVNDAGTLFVLSSGISVNNSIANASAGNNSTLTLATTGSTINRNIADTNVALIVQQVHASSTGDILQLKNNASTVLTVSQPGTLTSLAYEVSSISGLKVTAAAATSLFLSGTVADGASAVGNILDNSIALSNAGSKLLSVRNATSEKAYVDYVGLGYFAGGLQIPNNTWLKATNNAGSGTVNVISVNTSDEIVFGAAVNLGTIAITADSGAVTIMDMPVSSTPVAGTEESISFAIDSTNFLKLYTESSGAGGIQNSSIKAFKPLILGVAGGTTGELRFSGTTSGVVTVKSVDAAGTWTLTLPTDDGDAGEVLTTNGSGVCTWEAVAGGGANTALSNLAAVAINTTLVSDTDNTDALGTTAIAWSDLFLGSGAVITFNSAPSTADVTITHSANALAFAGGIVSFDTAPTVGAAAILYSGGALGTPSSGTVTNLTGTASININGTVGATTPATGAFTTITGASSLTLGAAGGTTGSLVLTGTTSGAVTVNVAAAAGTWTMTLPTDDGAASQFLQTNGSGVCTWATPTATPDESYIKADTISISSADFLAINATPKQLIAAPAAGKAICVDEYIISFTYGGTQYTGGGTAVIPVYAGGTSNLLGTDAGSRMASSLFNGTSNFIAVRTCATTPIGLVAATAVNLYASADFATGNGTAKVFIKYRIITL